jgi:hypothetical protein
VRFSLAPAVVVLEGARTVPALRRSAQLVRGAWWRIFGFSLLVWVVAMVASQLLGMPANIITELPTGDGGLSVVAMILGGLIAVVVSLAGSLFSTAFPQLVSGLLYVDRRIRTENLATELAAAAGLGGPPPQPRYPYPPQDGPPPPA